MRRRQHDGRQLRTFTPPPEKFNSPVGLNLGVDDDVAKSVDEVMEVVRAAQRESGITYVDFNTGHYAGDAYLDILCTWQIPRKRWGP